MKKYSIFFLFIIVAFTACNDNFKVGADYKDYTVVFGLLSKNDTAHYIKITKGFFSETENNLVIAQNVDSLYYQNLDVKLLEMSNGTVLNTYPLTKVDLNNEGYAKDSGTFVNTPNYAYKCKQTLDASKTFKLVIKNIATGKEVYGETDVIDVSSSTFSITSPGVGFVMSFALPDKNYTFKWKAPSNAAVFDITLRFNYEEKDNNTQIITQKTVDLPLAKNIAYTQLNMSFDVNTKDFYSILNAQLKPALSYITRFVDTPDVVVSAAGQQLKTYIDVTSSQGGITYDQIKPFYTNMKGENVLGIFSTRASTYSYHIPFSAATVDSIINGVNTKNLNIIGVSSK